MRILRTTSACMLASVALTITLPAAAADKEYALKLTASAYSGLATVTATFRNTSPGGGASSNIKSLQLEAPAGVVLSNPSNPLCRPLDGYPNVVRCENLTPIPKNGEFQFDVTANLPTSACGARWNLDDNDVNTGAQYGVGNWFTLVIPPAAPAGYTATLTAGLTPRISIVGPSNLLLGHPATITATVLNACGTATNNVSLTATVAGDGTYSLAPPGSSNSPVLYTLTANTGTYATITVTSTNPAATSSQTFEVFKELLSCVEDPQDETPSFNGSVGATSETQSGWFQGSRYTGGKPCTLVPYRTTNTITSGGGVTVNGYTLGANSALISYALPNPDDSILLAHTITFAPVWSNDQGLFDPARIKYCKKLPSGVTDCTPSATSTPNPNLLVAQGCSSPAIEFVSIPGTEPGCVRAWATEIVASSRCASPAPSGGNRTCMLVSIDVLEGKDPPWGITD